MKHIFVYFILLLIGSTVNAQGFISMKRSAVKKQLTKFYAKHNVTLRFEETDSTLTCFPLDSTGTNIRSFTYFFKDNNRCYKENAQGNCEPCFTRMFTDATLVKRYKWKKLSDNLYLSKPLWNLTLIRTNEEASFSYTIVKNYFNRTAHTKLYKSKL